MQAVAAEAMAAGADTLITCGGVQSNHARVTAAAGAALGLRVMLVLESAQPHGRVATGNARLDRLFGAEIQFVESREERAPAMEEAAADAARRRPAAVRHSARRVDAARRASASRAASRRSSRPPASGRTSSSTRPRPAARRRD